MEIAAKQKFIRKMKQKGKLRGKLQDSRASSLWKLKQNNIIKKGPFFGPQNVRSSRRRKNGPPQWFCVRFWS